MDRQSQNLFEFGPFTLDTEERLLLRGGQRVALTPKVFETLVALVEHRGRLVEKDKLMKLVWPDSFVEEANLTNNISTLRRALGESEGGANYIETVPRIGYRFTAPVRELPRLVTELVVEKHSLTRIETQESEVDTPSTIVVNAPASVTDIVTHAEAPRRARYNVLLIIAACLVLAAIGTAAGYWILSQRGTDHRAVSVPFSTMEISRLTNTGKSKHAAISPDGKYIAHITEDPEGNSLWIRHVTAPSEVRLSGPAESEYLWVAFAPDGNSIYYITLDRDKGDTMLYRIPVLGGPSTSAGYDLWPVGFSPDRKEMAFIRMNKGESYLIVANADSTNQRILARRQKPDFFRGEWNAPAWSPDGQSIACPARLTDEKGEFETILRIDPKSGSQTPLTSMRWGNVDQPVWLADGTGVLLTARERSTTPSQVWHIAIKTGEVTRVTHDLNDYHDLSLTQDSSKFAVVQDQTVSNIWVARDGDIGGARQIVTETGLIDLIAWTGDGHIVYRSNAGENSEVWITNADGTMRRQLTTDARVSGGLTVSPDDRYIFFVSDRAGHFNIWRIDADGQNLTQITKGDGEFFPECSPNGEWLIYQQGYYEPRLWKIRADGSSPVQLTVTRGNRPAISADGKTIAYHYLDPEIDEKSQWSIGIVPFEGGPRLQRFNLLPTVGLTGKFVRWFPDQKSIAYVSTQGGFSDIWLQPIDGSPPKRLTEFRAEKILVFDWSRDGRSLAFVREIETRDVVLIEQH